MKHFRSRSALSTLPRLRNALKDTQEEGIFLGTKRTACRAKEDRWKRESHFLEGARSF
jgi:hypothetical protein